MDFGLPRATRRGDVGGEGESKVDGGDDNEEDNSDRSEDSARDAILNSLQLKEVIEKGC